MTRAGTRDPQALGPWGRRYGYGAASLPVYPPLGPRCSELPGLRAGMRAARADRAGRSGWLSTLLRASPALTLAFVLTFLLATLTTPPDDPTRIVPFAQETPPPEPLEIAHVPEPRPAAPEPQRRTPEPPVEREPPEASPPPEPSPAPPPRAVPAPPPLLAAAAPPPAPRRSRPTGPASPRERSRPQLRPAAIQALPDGAPRPAPRERARFAQVQPAPGPRPVLAPGSARIETPVAEPVRPTRGARPDLAAARSAAPHLAMAAPPPSAGGAPSPAAPARSRRGPAPVPGRTASRSSRPSLSAPTTPTRSGGSAPRPAPPRPSRSQPTPAAPAATRSQRRKGLAGVPLGSLAACVSDAREGALIQQLVGRVGDRRSCASAAGRYHFVETKNVNAFLMRIERASGRRVGDRCAELTYALDCIGRRGS